MDYERSRTDFDRLGRGAHPAPTLEAKIDLGRVGVTVIGARLTRLPTGDRDIAFADPAEHSFHVFLGVERLLRLQIEHVHLPLLGSYSSVTLGGIMRGCDDPGEKLSGSAETGTDGGGARGL